MPSRRKHDALGRRRDAVITLRCHLFINKFRSIEPSCYAVVEYKTSKWFAGECVSLLSGVRLYVLSGHWTDEFQYLVLLDKDGNRRQTYKDMVCGFKADNGKTMYSLCDLAFTS